MSITEDKPQDYESLLAQITHPKKRAFLENYPKFCVTQDTCSAIGMGGDSSLYRWLHEDEVFNQTFGTLKKRIDSHRLEQVEKEVHDRAMGGTSKQSDILLMFEAKALHPDKYREKPPMMAQIAGNVIIKMDIPPYRDELPKGETNAIQRQGITEGSGITGSQTPQGITEGQPN